MSSRGAHQSGVDKQSEGSSQEFILGIDVVLAELPRRNLLLEHDI